MSMIGSGADNVIYSRSSRFQSAQMGLGIPLFFGAQKARIHSAKSLQLISESNYKLGLQGLQTDYLKTIAMINSLNNILVYYEITGNKNAKLIDEAAGAQFQKGEINYLEWAILMNQSLGIKTEYLNTIKQYNDAAIHLNYLLSK